MRNMYKEGRPEKSFKTLKKVRMVYVYGANIAPILCKMEYVNESDCNKPKQSHSPTHSPTPSLPHSLTHSLTILLDSLYCLIESCLEVGRTMTLTG